MGKRKDSEHNADSKSNKLFGISKILIMSKDQQKYDIFLSNDLNKNDMYMTRDWRGKIKKLMTPNLSNKFFN